MPKSPKKSLSRLIPSIAKKNKISLKMDAVIRPSSSSSRVSSHIVHDRFRDIMAPNSRPCGSREKSPNRYYRDELVKLARASGVDSKQDMDSLCRILGINPHAASVPVPAKTCNTSARGSDRYTRDDVVALARARGIAVSGKTMDELCDTLGINISPYLLGGFPSEPSSAASSRRPSVSSVSSVSSASSSRRPSVSSVSSASSSRRPSVSSLNLGYDSGIDVL